MPDRQKIQEMWDAAMPKLDLPVGKIIITGTPRGYNEYTKKYTKMTQVSDPIERLENSIESKMDKVKNEEGIYTYPCCRCGRRFDMENMYPINGNPDTELECGRADCGEYDNGEPIEHDDIDSMCLGRAYVAYVYDEKGKEVHQAFLFVPLAKKDNQVHVMGDVRRVDDKIIAGALKIPFDELSKRDGNVVNLKYSTWSYVDGKLFTEYDRYVKYKIMV